MTCRRWGDRSDDRVRLGRPDPLSTRSDPAHPPRHESPVRSGRDVGGQRLRGRNVDLYGDVMSALTEYMNAWVAGSPTRIAERVAAGCVITECYGPVYRGRPRIQEWARTWFDAGGIVHSWTLTDHFSTPEREAAQWIFECTWKGERGTFEGATISRHVGGLISELREYETSAPLYDWDGTWH